MSGKDLPFSLWPTANVYSIGWRSVTHSISPEAHPLARSVRELLLAVGEFMHITARDVLEGLDMNQPKNAAPPPFVPLFSWVLSPPVDKQEAMPVPEETR